MSAAYRRLSPPDSLTVFSYVWAAQTLCQLAVFRSWLREGQVTAWVLLLIAVLVLLFPGRLRLFLVMLLASVVHYVSVWPFVSNHVLVDTILTLTMLAGAIALTGHRLLTREPVTKAEREAIFNGFAPVCCAIFIFIYYSIIISKLNSDSFDIDISCMSMMYGNFVSNRPVFGNLLGVFSVEFLFWLFIVIEIVIPVLLTIRRTRLLALYFGLPFHFLLGLMGHWAFSSMVISLYVLTAMPAILQVLDRTCEWLEARLRPSLDRGVSPTVLFAGANAVLLLLAFITEPRWVWLSWTAILVAVAGYAALRCHARNGLFTTAGVVDLSTARPPWLWIFFVVAVINSMSPYIGFKTQTSVAMYSNMRTEGGVNNHFFMPVIPLFRFQDDLVEVISSNHRSIDELRKHSPLFEPDGKKYEVYVNYFELRRAVS